MSLHVFFNWLLYSKVKGRVHSEIEVYVNEWFDFLPLTFYSGRKDSRPRGNNSRHGSDNEGSGRKLQSRKWKFKYWDTIMQGPESENACHKSWSWCEKDSSRENGSKLHNNWGNLFNKNINFWVELIIPSFFQKKLSRGDTLFRYVYEGVESKIWGP